MFPAANYQIEADRYTPHSDYIEIEGYDFTGAVVAMEVRDRPNGGDVRATITPTIAVTQENGVDVSIISWTVTEADMEAMPLDPSDAGADVTLYYDVLLTPDGGTKFKPFGGKFVVKSGVTA